MTYFLKTASLFNIQLETPTHTWQQYSNTIPDMAIRFHTKSHGRFREIMNNHRGRKLRQTDKVSDFLESIFSNRDNVGSQSNLEQKENLIILKVH